MKSYKYFCNYFRELGEVLHILIKCFTWLEFHEYSRFLLIIESQASSQVLNNKQCTIYQFQLVVTVFETILNKYHKVTKLNNNQNTSCKSIIETYKTSTKVSSYICHENMISNVTKRNRPAQFQLY